MEITEEYTRIISGEICPYCDCGTELVTDKDIYGPLSTFGGNFYRCLINHDHYVGCHEGSKKSYGRIADKKLRELKHKGHEIFDPLWKNKPKVFRSRATAYYWLSKRMNIHRNYTHFGFFDEEQCIEAINIIENFIKKLDGRK